VELRRTAFSEEIERLFARDIAQTPGVDVRTYVGDISTMPRDGNSRFVFVSPGNSLGFMDGGIDRVYSRTMFPGCERSVKDKIRALGLTTDLGRPYLPVGSAVVVKHPEHPNFVDSVPSPFPKTFLIAAPTMFLPHDVSSTRNAYHAFSAVSNVFASCSDIPSDAILVCPDLCCGYGRMDPRESARQVFQAYIDHYSQKKNDAERRTTDDTVYIGVNRDAEQPDNFDNREIKNVPLTTTFR